MQCNLGVSFRPCWVLLGVLNGSELVAQWSFDPLVNTPVCTVQYNQRDVQVVSDTKGGAIICWTDFRNDATGSLGDIYAQRVNAQGIPVWMLNGQPICTHIADQAAPSMTEDGHGGTIIGWNDWRNGNRDIYAQRIDSGGNILWSGNGVAVVTKPQHQQDSRLASDGAGGAVVVWQDSANGNWDIYSQRLSGLDGSGLWTASGAPICSAFGFQINARLEADGIGGAMIVWQDRRNGADYDIYAQRVSNLGLVQWDLNGIIIASNAGSQTNPKIEPDGSGGASIAWQDDRTGAGYNVYAQRVDPGGTIRWAPNGVSACLATGSQSAVDMTTDVSEGCIITWKDARSGSHSDIYAQRLDSNGMAQWQSDGVPICTADRDQNNPSIVGNGIGGAIITWQDSLGGGWDIKAQSIDSNGVTQWLSGGAAVGIASGHQTDPKLIATGNGGAIFAWQDKRSGVDFDIYAHHVAADGTGTGHEILDVSSLSLFPNPLRPSGTLHLNGGAQPMTQVLIHDIMGRAVAAIVDYQHNGQVHITVDMPSGLYICMVRTPSGRSQSIQFIITE